MLQILMDSAGDMPPDWAEEFHINTIPINIHFGEQTFLQGIDITNRDFYRMADESGVIPKTSQPTPQQFVEVYKKIAAPGETILSVHVTGRLSGTLASAEIAAKELEAVYHIILFDSASGSAAMGYMCREARIMERKEQSLDLILNQLDQIRKNTQIILTLDSMEYARRSGRVKALQAALASLLNVKPVIFLHEGVLELGEKVRTRTRSLEYIIEEMSRRIGNQRARVAVVHAEDPESSEKLVALVQERLNCAEIIVTELSIGVAANLGPGTVGIVAYPA